MPHFESWRKAKTDVKLKQRKLANGMEVHYSSKANLKMLEREMFDESLYLRHGIELNEGDCIFDVGANIGFFVMFLNQHLNEATVHSFEPIPETYELLLRNVRDHNELQLDIYNCGLSNQAGTATFTHYPKTNACSTMYPQGSTTYVNNSRQFVLSEIRNFNPILKTLVDRTPRLAWWPITEMVRRYFRSAVNVQCQLRTLSDVIDQHEIQQIDYLKVDTEGAEIDVLKGIRPEHWPMVKQVVIEVHEGKPALEQVLALLTLNGFQCIVEQPCQRRDHLNMVYATRLAERDSSTAILVPQ